MPKKTEATTRTKPYRMERFGIMNHVGGIWTPETFDSEDRARLYLTRMSLDNPTWNLKRHKVVPVRVTVSAIKS